MVSLPQSYLAGELLLFLCDKLLNAQPLKLENNKSVRMDDHRTDSESECIYHDLITANDQSSLRLCVTLPAETVAQTARRVYNQIFRL